MLKPLKRVTTQLLDAQEPTAVAEAAAAIGRGELVVLPTDTVYGVGTTAMDPEAIQALYAAKLRSQEKGIPILIADMSDLEHIAVDIPARAWPLIERFWPGPLTLILRRNSTLPAVLAPGDTIAVRMPDHVFTRAVIRSAGGAIAMTSANQSGQPPAQTAVQALQELAGSVTIVVDGGSCDGGLASTVLNCTGPVPQILREGPISAMDLGLKRD